MCFLLMFAGIYVGGLIGTAIHLDTEVAITALAIICSAILNAVITWAALATAVGILGLIRRRKERNI